MPSVLAWLSFPLVLTALACGNETPAPAPNGGNGAAAGVSTTGGASMGGNATQGGSTQGGVTSGNAGQQSGAAGPGGSDTGGAATGAAGGDGAAGLAGATAGGMGGVGGSSGTGGGLAGAPVGGAGSGDTYATGVTITVHAQVRTILNVAWTQAMAAESVFLEFTFESGNVMTSRPKPGTVGMHTDVVLGAPGSTPVTVRVVSRQGGVDYKTHDYMQTTGAVPTGMPVGQVVMYNAAIASPDRWMFGAVENSAGGCNSSNCYYNATFWLYIMDRKGRIVWYYSDVASDATSSFQRIARDGEYIWIEKRPFSSQLDETRTVLKRTLDGTYSQSVSVPDLSDCIDVTTDGSLLYDTRQRDSELRELTRAGTTHTIWRCRDTFTSGSCYSNTVNWNEAGNTVVLSFPERRTVLEINRTNGTVVGQYGADSGSYSFASTPAPPAPATAWEFGFQHFANITKDGTLMLSTHMPGYRTTNMPVAGQHAFEEYTIDRTNRRLTMLWFHQSMGEEWAMYKGMAVKLPNNNVLANFGTGGIIREITPDKQTAFMVKFDAPAGSAGNDFFNKMVGNNVLINDLYALNGGGPRP